MLVVNIGSQGMYKEMRHGTMREGKQFEPGVNVEVSDKMGEYLLGKYNRPRLAIYFQKALDAQEHEAIQAEAENPTPDMPVVQPKKRGRKPKQK